jgi:hypothetical protein
MFIGSSRKDDDLALSRQESINYYVETQGPGSRAQRVLRGAPGTDHFAEVGEGPLRAMINLNGTLYAISGRELYRVDANGNGTLLGTMDENAPPSVSLNLTQVVITNGVNGYVYDAAANTFTKQSSPNFYSSTSVTYQDGYSIYNRAETGQFFVSDIDDALSYSAIDFDEAVLRGDNLLAVTSDSRNVWLIGSQTSEPWYNNGQLVGVPFIPNTGAASLRGTAAGRSVVSSQIGIFLLGDDHNVYWIQGYNFKNISDDSLSRELGNYRNVADAFGFMMNTDGHWFYVLTLPTQGRTFVYDPEEGEWHNRRSYGLTYWRASCYAECYGMSLVGDSQSGKIGRLARDVYTEYGEHWVSERYTGTQSAKNRTITFNMLELVFPSGQVPQNLEHKAALRYSDDKGMTFNNPRIMDIGTAGKGKQRCQWHMLGDTLDRVWHVYVSTPANRDLIEESVEFEVGDA